MVGYDTASLDPKRLGKDGSADLKAIAEHAVATSDGPVSIDRYGRRVPKPATGAIALPEPTSATSRICDAVDKLFLSIVDRRLLVRRLNVVAADVLTDEQLEERRQAAASEYTFRRWWFQGFATRGRRTAYAANASGHQTQIRQKFHHQGHGYVR